MSASHLDDQIDVLVDSTEESASVSSEDSGEDEENDVADNVDDNYLSQTSIDLDANNKIEELSSANLALQKRIFELEHQAYKTNDQLTAAKKKIDEKESKISSLKSEISTLRREHRKQEIMMSAENILGVCYFECEKNSSMLCVFFCILFQCDFDIFF